MITEISEGFRLSPQQRRIWSLRQDGPAYRAQCAIFLEGKLEIASIREAIRVVTDRHEILHTLFHRVPGMDMPIQVIVDDLSPTYEESDLTAYSDAEQRTATEDHAAKEMRAPFDYERGPLARYCLLKQSANRNILLVTLDALCADRLTLRSLVREISRAYDACVTDRGMTDDPAQYADLAEWQNELLESDATHQGRSHWENQDFSSLLNVNLSAQEMFRNESDFRPEALSVRVEASEVKQIETLSQEAGVTVSEFLLACWHILHRRLQGNREIILGVAPNRRKYAELEHALGPLGRFIPFRSELDEGTSLKDALLKVRQSWSEANEWEEYFSLEQLERSSQWPGERSFFPVAFEYSDFSAIYEAGELRFSILGGRACADRFSLKLSCLQLPDSLITEFHYDRESFSQTAIENLAIRFYELLKDAASHPEKLIDRLKITGEAERQKTVGEFGRSQATTANETCLHRLFEAQVERTPESIAVICGGEQITYGELNARANKMANLLIGQGVGVGNLVGICAPRSIDMIVGLIGILKAGAAYVPLDPALPKARASYILKDARVACLLTRRALADRFEDSDFSLVCLDDYQEQVAIEFDSNPERHADPDDLAYIIYTSGSTGHPKGVMVSHRAICNRVLWGQSVYPLSGSDRVLQGASPGFDFSVWEIFAPLLAGACVVIPETQGPTDTSYLVRLISERRVTTAHFVPSLLQLIVDEDEFSECDDLKIVFSGGEALPPALKDRFFMRMGAQLINQYGPTEATVDATYHYCLRDGDSRSVPIGRPIAETQTYILDRHLEPVPIGATGELHIGGTCLARGYLNRPDLTAEKFIPNPFAERPGERLYKSGDLARFLPDGDIEFLGRIDHQIKLRGMRVELGEVEAFLLQHPAVREAVVIVREDPSGDQRMIAYLVPHGDREVNPGDLQNFLRDRLPEFMIPSVFVALASLPLLTSGKVDRKALPACDESRSNRSENFLAPRTPLEKTLKDLWEKVLGIERLGVRDNFFEAGGHSLMAMQLISRVRSQFQIELPLRHLFENPTVEALATVVEDLLVERIGMLSEEEAERLLASGQF